MVSKFFAPVLLLFLSSVLPAQLIGVPIYGNSIGMLCFGDDTIGGFATAITPMQGTAPCYSMESIGFPISVPSPFSSLDVLNINPNTLLEIKPAFASSSGVEWMSLRVIPNDPSMHGVEVITQFLHLTSPEWRLSQGWIYVIQ